MPVYYGNNYVGRYHSECFMYVSDGMAYLVPGGSDQFSI